MFCGLKPIKSEQMPEVKGNADTFEGIIFSRSSEISNSEKKFVGLTEIIRESHPFVTGIVFEPSNPFVKVLQSSGIEGVVLCGCSCEDFKPSIDARGVLFLNGFRGAVVIADSMQIQMSGNKDTYTK